MSRIDNETFYSAAISQHGHSPKGVHWNSKSSQQKRFEVLCSFIKKEEFSLVDVGCGFADLYLYMREHEYACNSYIGIDLSETMVQIAQARTKQEILCLDGRKDRLPEADYYICSGGMNILTRFDTYLFIRNCFRTCKKAFVFNLLLGDDTSSIYNKFFPHELQDLFDELGAKVSVLEGYLKGDFTVCMEKV